MATEYRLLGAGRLTRASNRQGDPPALPRIGLRIAVGRQAKYQEIVLTRDTALRTAASLIQAVIATKEPPSTNGEGV